MCGVLNRSLSNSHNPLLSVFAFAHFLRSISTPHFLKHQTICLCTRCSRVWLVKPRAGLSTPVVFRRLDYERLSKEDPEELLRRFTAGGVPSAKFINDLEFPAFEVMPALRDMKTELQVRLGGQHCSHE